MATPSGTISFKEKLPADKFANHLLKLFFSRRYHATVIESTLQGQLAGIDLHINLPGRTGPAAWVSADAKGDFYTSGNLTLELISQNLGHRSRKGPALGWPFKEACLVPYIFLATGECVLINMLVFYPWLMERLGPILEGDGHCVSPQQIVGGWLAGTPNPQYNSYNLNVPICRLLLFAPGVIHVNLLEEVPPDEYLMLWEQFGLPSRTRLAPQMARPAPGTSSTYLLTHWLKTLPLRFRKNPLDALQVERLVRWAEERAQFKKDAAVQKAGQAHIARRKAERITLPEDGTAIPAEAIRAERYT